MNPEAELKEPLILHVEDDDGDARVVARALSKADFDVRLERLVDGRAALESVEAMCSGAHEIPTMVLLDLKLPYATGFDILEAARKCEALACVPIVVFTSSNVEEDHQRCEQLGCTAYMVKPIDFGEFQNLIKNVCRKYVVPV